MSERQLRWLAARVDEVGAEQQLHLFLPSFTRFITLPDHPVIEIKMPSGVASTYAIVSINNTTQTIIVVPVFKESDTEQMRQNIAQFTHQLSKEQVIEVTAPFSQPENNAEVDFYITLARKGITLAVPKGVSISDVMREHNLHVNTSCEYGVCGTCYTTVLSGEIIHEDTYLMDDEKETQDCMMICVSRGKPGTTLVLDL